MRRFSRTHTHWYLVAAAFALPAALSSFGCHAGPTYEQSTEPPTCEVTADCPEVGQICSLDGHCFEPVSETSRIGIELVPQSSEKEGSVALTRVEYPPSDVVSQPDGTVELVYEEPVKLFGLFNVATAYAVEDTDFEVFEASLSVWRPSRIPGRPKVLYSTSVSLDIESSTISDFESTDYVVHVPAGDTYALKASPKGHYAKVYPPLVAKDLVVAEDEQRDFQFQLEGNYIWATGRVVNALGEGMPNIQAELRDYAGIYSSTISEPTGQDGYFQVALPPGQRDYTLSLTPTVNATAIPALEFVLEDVGHVEGYEPIVLTASDGHDFEYPALLAPCQYTYRVVGKSSSGTREPVPGASVTFTTHVGGGTHDDGVIRTQATADGDGRVTVDLIPGENRNSRSYEAVVVPPLGSSFAAASLDVTISRCGGTGADLELSARAEVVGVVRAFGGALVSNLTIEAQPSPATNDGPTPSSLIASAGLSPTATTASDGRFFLELDPGFYDFELVPPAGSYLPRWLVSDIQVRADAPPIDLSFNLRPPRLLMGRVVDEQGQPVAGFDVKIYGIHEECPEEPPCELPAFYMGEGQTDGEGRFQVIVPEQ